MTPGPRGRGARGQAHDGDVYGHRRRKKRRTGRKSHRRRVVVLGFVAFVALLLAVAGAAVTQVATFGSSCDLDSLKPIEIGQNSFVYAADNSRLGVIPAEKNRQPVPLRKISPWMPKATVAIEDRRFYEHGGV